jgi:membrane-bound serine protease (ClpP class)
MEIFLNANVAYLLLVSGFVLALLALVTPGTGFIEAGAFLLLVLAGYAIYMIGFNLWALVILLLSFVPFIYAIRKPGREWALAISLLGVIAGSLYMFPSQGLLPAVHPILAALVSLALAAFLWWSVRKVVAAHTALPIQDLRKLIDQIGEAKTRVHEEGSVQVAGELWSARSDRAVPAGTRIRVIAREGFILVVEPADQADK